MTDALQPTAVSSDALWTRIAAVLRLILALAAVGFIAMFIIVALIRLGYPYELEWMEGATVDTVARILNGQPVYAQPSVEYVAPVYTPLSYYFAALIALITGNGFIPARLVSIIGIVGSFALIYRIVQRERNDRTAGLIAAGLFAATYRATGAWFDIARVDSLMLCLLLIGIYSLKFHPTPRGYLFAGIAFALSFLTKQLAVIPIAFLCLYPLLTQPRRILYLVAPMGLIVGGVTLLFEIASGGWYWYSTYTVNAGLQAGGDPTAIRGFWTSDMLLMSAAILISVLFLALRVREGEEGLLDFRFYLLLTAGVILASWISRIRSGGWVNVLFPTYATLAILFGQGINIFTRKIPRPLTYIALYAVCLIQFVALMYNPMAQIPTDADRAAGDALIARLRETEGDLLMFAHGYYPEMAGKVDEHGSSRYKLGWSYVITLGTSGEPRQVFIDDVTAAIEAKQFGAILLDNALFTHEEFSAVIEANYTPEELTFEGAAFFPITGMEVRPWYLYTPKP